MQNYGEILGADGPLAAHIPDYAPRPQQQAMADSVGRALETLSTLVVEAGTGTGKTFAYLVPAVLCGRKVLISTGTRNLQDQLFNKDLPTVSGALGVPVKIALLKGRANYLCRHRLTLEEEEARYAGASADPHLGSIRRWAQYTQVGDVGEVTNVPENAAIWPRVTSTRENCLGVECKDYSRCHVVAARRTAQEADIVIVNHHLLLADLALKEEGFGELLPGADAVILDEAHQVPDTAAHFFGVAVSSGQLSALAEDVVAESFRIQAHSQLQKIADALVKAVRDCRLLFPSASGRLEWSSRPEQLEKVLGELGQILEDLVISLEAFGENSKGLQNCQLRAIDLQDRLAKLSRDVEEEGIRWLDLRARGFSLHLTPFDVAQTLHGFIHDGARAWVFTSATLAVGEDFTHFVSRVGVEEPETARLESPFDFPNKALLYLPEQMPLPSSPDYTREVIDRSSPVLVANRGGSFILFTSHRALAEAARYLRDSFPGESLILVQGEAPRDELLQRFRATGNAILLGTSSFWEGVDVRGDALSVVIIDKLPFASPGDPVLQARLQAVRREGRNPFMEYQVPQAAIALKQGVGRLIRDNNDRGVVVICDPRITAKRYGAVFLDSLPPMSRTHSLAEVTRFLAHDPDARCGDGT